MKILVINCGSSSLKYQVFDMSDESVLAKGLVEKIGLPGSFLKHRRGDEDNIIVERNMPNHEVAIGLVIGTLLDEKQGVVKSMDEILAVGHRVVHAGERYASSVLINDDVMQALRQCIELAPLHNPPNIMGIEVCEKLMPNAKHVAVFDTAFHQTMPQTAYLYALPLELYKKHGIRRYGFHGTSHRYVSERAAHMLGRAVSEVKVITCHLGNGASVAAIDGGKSIDTSMGFTPLEGLMMGTRSGDLDPAVVPFLMEKESMNSEQISSFLNKKCGVMGISEVSSDFRVVEGAAAKGNEQAQLALHMYYYRVRKYVGAYAAALGSVDAIVFTAGLGENSPEVREEVCKHLGFMGVELDLAKNRVRGKEVDLSSENAKVKVLLIPTNEELIIARDTKGLVDSH
ncbi:MAG: Acetate kinase [Firmicutes bacterium]|nr:Acetate kinase [candidate division NPL-UPA2 bacterium]MBT9156595.1 Acetate kinase [candidate division NPL-UPA2 bacterium]